MPSFARALPGGPQRDYGQRRRAHEAARQSTQEQFADTIAQTKHQRAETIRAFRSANHQREAHFSRVREEFRADQDRRFGHEVQRERAREASGKAREVFTRSAGRERGDDGRVQ